MNTLAILTALISAHSWSTTCVMTQADGMQGYAIDTAVFQKDSATTTPANTLNVAVTRAWYKDSGCANLSEAKVIQAGTVSLGDAITTSSFASTTPETTIAADWTTTVGTQLGALAMANDQKSIRTVTGSLGTSRNTMLSLFRFFAN